MQLEYLGMATRGREQREVEGVRLWVDLRHRKSAYGSKIYIEIAARQQVD